MRAVIILAAVWAVAFANGINFPNIPQNYGYINANTQYGVNLFYWEFDSLADPATDPLVVWLTGEPGCSSEMALFFENGPYTVNDDLTLTFNNYTWNSNANLLFVDHPGGAGFSYVNDPSGYVQNEDQVAEDFYTFLIGFFKKYPKFVGRDFYITGESYSGHYIPAISTKIVDMNKKSNFTINLKAVAIGNGLIDPLIQYKSYAPYLYSHGLISQDTVQDMNQLYVQCQQDIKAGDYTDTFDACMNVFGIGLSGAGDINIFDIRKTCDGGLLCYNLDNIVSYLNKPSVIKKLGVQGVSWATCNMDVYQDLQSDFQASYRFDLVKLLANNIRVLLYNGNYDYVANFYGAAEMVNTMQWSGQQAFLQARNTTWNYNGKAVGNSRSANGLTFVVVYNAGHMVPHDQPAAALDLLNRFIKNKPFN